MDRLPCRVLLTRAYTATPVTLAGKEYSILRFDEPLHGVRWYCVSFGTMEPSLRIIGKELTRSNLFLVMATVLGLEPWQIQFAWEGEDSLSN